MSYLHLEKLLEFNSSLPVTVDWSAAPDFLELISHYCLENKPLNIVECSSGTSSIVLARCCQINKYGCVYSLENGGEFADKTRSQLKDFSLSNDCEVLYAPLESVMLHDEVYQWYDLQELATDKIDMLVIDGPPGFFQKHSRYPALPLLHDRLSKECVIFLDDAARDDEQTLVKRWLREYPEFHLEYIENERGCAILKR
jgi:predicted O-methyltransferase YrrM